MAKCKHCGVKIRFLENICQECLQKDPEARTAVDSQKGPLGPPKIGTGSHVTFAIGTLAGIALIIFGAALIDSGGQPGNAIIGLFGVLMILAGGFLSIFFVIPWIFATVAQLFGTKGIVALVLVVLALGYFFFDNFANTLNA